MTRNVLERIWTNVKYAVHGLDMRICGSLLVTKVLGEVVNNL
jgi:hypothetical protein